MEQVEQGQGLEQIVPVVHIRLGWVSVPQMWAFVLCIVVSANLMPGPAVVAQVVHKKLWLRTGTSFLHSPEFFFGLETLGVLLGFSGIIGGVGWCCGWWETEPMMPSMAWDALSASR